MNRSIRHYATIVLLVAFGLPSVLGFGLHLLSGSHTADGKTTSCCDCCRAERAADQNTLRPDLRCAICEFLALVKTVDQGAALVPSFELVSTIRLRSVTSLDVAEIPRPSAPRAPPV